MVAEGGVGVFLFELELHQADEFGTLDGFRGFRWKDLRQDFFELISERHGEIRVVAVGKEPG